MRWGSLLLKQWSDSSNFLWKKEKERNCNQSHNVEKNEIARSIHFLEYENWPTDSISEHSRGHSESKILLAHAQAENENLAMCCCLVQMTIMICFRASTKDVHNHSFSIIRYFHVENNNVFIHHLKNNQTKYKKVEEKIQEVVKVNMSIALF